MVKKFSAYILPQSFSTVSVRAGHILSVASTVATERFPAINIFWRANLGVARDKKRLF
jgi:hypothetical protein